MNQTRIEQESHILIFLGIALFATCAMGMVFWPLALIPIVLAPIVWMIWSAVTHRRAVKDVKEWVATNPDQAWGNQRIASHPRKF